jgi:O-antigen/teichoic acid export membrane protein
LEAAKRVAKNTGILYARMAITVFISLYSTRLILAALGVADFGLFNVVGGVISMLGFLNSSMAAATQRFMSFAQGAGDLEKVKRIFNMSSLLHWGIAVLVFILLEGAGYFFFHGILNIAPDRLEVAKLIYHFMVISTLFTVISVPYEAVITSHENMLVYAVMGVIESVLKLGIAFYITYAGMDHLVLYGVLMAALSIFLLLIKRIYCHRVYEECNLHIGQYYDKPLLKEMGGFAGWSLLGSSSGLIANYGQTIVLNIYFGTFINAAQAIAGQISGQLGVFSTTLTKALNPVIDKYEGSGDRLNMIKATLIGTKLSFFLLSVLYIPFLLEMPLLLKIWLINVPEYAILFCRLLLIRNLIEQFYIPLINAISAVGNIESYQKFNSFLNLIPITVALGLFYLDFPAYSLYVVFIIFSLVQFLNILIHSKLNFDLSYSLFFNEIVLKCVFVFVLSLFIGSIPFLFIKEDLIRLFIVTGFGIPSYLGLIWMFALSIDEKTFTNKLIKSSLSFFHNNKNESIKN